MATLSHLNLWLPNFSWLEIKGFPWEISLGRKLERVAAKVTYGSKNLWRQLPFFSRLPARPQHGVSSPQPPPPPGPDMYALTWQQNGDSVTVNQRTNGYKDLLLEMHLVLLVKDLGRLNILHQKWEPRGSIGYGWCLLSVVVFTRQWFWSRHCLWVLSQRSKEAGQSQSPGGALNLGSAIAW
jgi:hypothetical protein